MELRQPTHGIQTRQKQTLNSPHRNLVLVVGSFRVDITFPLQPPIVISAFKVNRETESIAPADDARFDITFFVAFKEFGKRQNQPIIPSLMQLRDEVRRVVAEFCAATRSTNATPLETVAMKMPDADIT